MDSESTSRSSVKDLPSATSSWFTPATSSRISARPEVISSRVAMVFVFPLETDTWNTGTADGQAPLRAADDLTGVGEATTEAEQQHRRPGGHLPALDQLRQGQRHTGRGGVAGLDQILRDDHVRAEAQPLDDAVDDPGVRLVRHERRQLGRLDAGA